MTSERNRPKAGRVYLVGTGPGDPGLLTLQGARLLSEADVVVYDWLVNSQVLEMAPQAEKIYAGKKEEFTHAFNHRRGGRRNLAKDQPEINRLLVKLAKKGKRVVRLKGGDPFVFGRGGEEASFLKKHRIRYEIIPGISAGLGAPAYAGIPVTDRRFSSVVIFATAHESRMKKNQIVNWEKIAAIDGTLVSFMGVKSFPSVITSLLKGGMSLKTKVSVIERGTLPRQRVVEGDLSNITGKIRKQKIESPAIAIFGKVNSLRKSLSWFVPQRQTYREKSLAGKTVLVTRATTQVSRLKSILKEKGASVMELPTIEIGPPQNWQPLDHAIRDLAKFDWILFTSTNGVESFWHRLLKAGKDARALGKTKIVAIGEATGRALSERGIRADFVPKTYTTEYLIKELKRKNVIQGRCFLLPRTDIAPEYLAKELQREGGDVTQVIAYRTLSVRQTHKEKQLLGSLEKGEIDFVTFTSSSTVKNLFDLIPKAKRKSLTSRMISIGPVTTGTLRSYGMRPYREAKEHTIDGLVKAIENGK